MSSTLGDDLHHLPSESQAQATDHHPNSPNECIEASRPLDALPQPVPGTDILSQAVPPHPVVVQKLDSLEVVADDQQAPVAKPEPSSGLPSGVAAIKNQYLLKRPLQELQVGSDDVDEPQPPPSKRKRRGQNKQRPRAIIPYSQLLCPKLHLHDGEACRYGDKCRYLHDVVKYMTVKPPDIGDRCYIYDTFGKCPYGAACRFAGCHLTEDFKNVVNGALFDPNRPSPLVNGVPKSLQENLRKKRFKFPRSEAFLRKLKAGGLEEVTGTGGVGGEPENGSQTDAAKDGTIPGGICDGGTDINCEDSLCRELGNCEDGLGSTQLQPHGSGEDCETGSLLEGSSLQGDSTTVTETRFGSDVVKSESSRSEVSATEMGKTCTGAVTDEDIVRLRPAEKKKIDFRGKLYLAPLTTVGNLPFRRICKGFGADITCGEMALCSSLLQGQQSEWALMKRHQCEDLFGVQVCGSFADNMARCAELLNSQVQVDFVDVNAGCPIDLVFKKGAGCALMERQNKFQEIVCGMVSVLDCPLTVKMRTGVYVKNWIAHKLVPKLRDLGVSMATIHGRSREQRYTKLADWEYIETCAQAAGPMPIFGNGDIMSFEDYYSHLESSSISGIMIARGALVKPWLFTEIKERRHWDISSCERFELLRTYTNYGLEHWGSDFQGVENTRKFLLEWLSFLHRYIPVGVLERVPQRMNERPPLYCGRDDMETLMGSSNCKDWVKISEMLLGPVPTGFTFLPKHKANSYEG